MKRQVPYNKIMWSKKMLAFIKGNYHRMTNTELAAALGLKLATVRAKCHELGLKRMVLEYWTEAQINALHSLYGHVGDKEIAMMFNEAFPKQKGWTLKHIEKKRNYLGLHRTSEQLKAIKQRNKAFGCWRVGSLHTWETREKTPLGEVHVWSNGAVLYPVVKTKDGFERLARHTWQQHNGSIPKSMNVVRKDLLLPEDDINNLELITNAELARRNANRYPKEIKDTVRAINKLKKALNEKQNNRPAQPSF